MYSLFAVGAVFTEEPPARPHSLATFLINNSSKASQGKNSFLWFDLENVFSSPLFAYVESSEGNIVMKKSPTQSSTLISYCVDVIELFFICLLGNFYHSLSNIFYSLTI